MAKILAVDFDGVINKYDSAKVRMEMNIGAKEALQRIAMSSDYELYVLTARKDTEAVSRFLYEQTGLSLEVTNVKRHADAYIDDHAFKFVSWEDTMGRLERGDL